jgi:hypothetical protein
MTSALVLAMLALPLPTEWAATRVDPPQRVEYRIEASLDEATDVLTGRAVLRYTNNASVTIDTLYFHQHLNAFRPNSEWARREAAEGEFRFQRLRDDAHAFERLTGVRVGDCEVEPVYPGAPDSTVVAVPLRQAIGPGASLEIELDWEARLSTTPRRQGREGRHYDWAHWYPRIAVFDADGWHYQPLVAQGEFWGEFASYDVTLEVERDQVVAATGVPVEGDPGWESALVAGEVHYARDAYPDQPAERLGLLAEAVPDGRKRMRWRAEEVIHFAWTADPELRYEGGLWGELPVHILYRPGGARAWGGGTALERTYRALEWSRHVFGDYVYPQLTIVERVERGGTEFPMLIMNGSASEGLIVHEVLHQYAHAILANNEWRDGWLDEGLTDYLTNRYFDAAGQAGVWDRALAAARARERRGTVQPVAIPGDQFRDFATYAAKTYTKAGLVFRMLEGLVGEETMFEILRTFYERNRLSHVDERRLRAAVEEVTGESYDWFFDQWLHSTDRLDYAILDAAASRLPDGRWRTVVTVERSGDAWMPVELQVGAAISTLDSRDRVQVVDVVTDRRPEAAVLDPRDLLLDSDPSNNRRQVR